MRKIHSWQDVCPKICRHPSHDPPNMIVLEPGVYEHVCPGCKAKKIINIPPKPYLVAK